MAQTFTAEDVTSIDEVKVFSDAALTVEVETLSNISDVGVGEFESDDEFTNSLYTLGTLFFARIKWTPVGGSQQTSLGIPFYIAPQAQASGSASVTDVSCGEGTHLQPPLLSLRLGRGGFRESDFENATFANTRDRFENEFPIPTDSRALFIHLLFANGRAGEPWSPAVMFGKRDFYGPYAEEEEPQETISLPFPAKGYRSDAIAPEFFLRQSRNFTIHEDVPRTRPGYLIRRQFTQATATYLKRIPVDQSDGTLKVAIQLGTTIFEDSASPTSRDATLTNPYAVDTNKVPQGVHVLGRWIQVNGTDADFRVMIFAGGQLEVKIALEDAGTPTLLATSSGSSLTQQLWFVRVRFYDEDTRTFSGPSQRTATAVSVTPTGGQAIRVTMPTAPARASHWQIQAAPLIDTPGSYQIDFTPVDGVGGSLVGDAVGRIPVGTTQAFIDTDPASGTQFEFRTVSGIIVYAHSKPPTGATSVAHFQGRIFYTSDTDTWLVYTETDEDGFGERFFNDPALPHAGFNTIDGEGLVDTVTSPNTALAATELNLLFFTRNSIILGEGSWVLDNNVRDARINILTQNTSGAISPSIQVVDQDVYFFAQDGPKVFSGGVLDLDSRAIREDWACRDPVFEHRYHIGYEPRYRLVVFSFVSKNAPIAGFPDVHLAWSVDKRQWCPPWEMDVSSWTLHRFNTDAGVIRGTRLMSGGPYGSMNEFGVGDGDGQDGSNATESDDLTSTSTTTTTVDVTGSGWTVNKFRGFGLFLQDRTTGRTYYRTIISNGTEQLVWEGAITNSGGGWIVNIGGIRKQMHTISTSGGKEHIVRRLSMQFFDRISLEGT